jgi:hypothetical protein
MSFRVEERETAKNRMVNDFGKLMSSTPEQKVASRHYINGLTLLGLEDQYSGLIDAAFMQFYQGCEVLLGKKSNDLREAKKSIAQNYAEESISLQTITHHVWMVRHSCFGHGNLKVNSSNEGDYEQTFQIAKQVLVARWLCKRLLDLSSDCTPLMRQISLYPQSGSVRFSGDLNDLKNNYCMLYDFDKIKVVDAQGKVIPKE